MRRIAHRRTLSHTGRICALYCTQQEGQAGVSSKKILYFRRGSADQAAGSGVDFHHDDLGRHLFGGASRDASQRAVLFVGLRFATATLALTLFSLRVLRGLTLYELKAGVLIGLAIMFGYSMQTVGLQTISSSQSAFITAMYVPIVPLLQWLVLGRFPGIMSWIGILLAFTGLMLLAAPSSTDMTLSLGEMLTLAGTLGMAAEIILIGAFAGKVNIRRVTIVQLATASLASFLMMVPTGESPPPYSDYLLYSAIGLGLASALIQLTMNWAQRSVSPTRATVIYAGEPVWAGIVGRLAGERLPGVALLGAR